MTSLRDAAQQALEVMQAAEVDPHSSDAIYRAITALKAALAEPVQEPVQEPVAIVGTQEDTWKGYGNQWAPPGPPIKTVHMLRELSEGTPLYTAPPQRKPLTEEEIHDCFQQRHRDKTVERRMIARAIERAHGIGK